MPRGHQLVIILSLVFRYTKAAPKIGRLFRGSSATEFAGADFQACQRASELCRNILQWFVINVSVKDYLAARFSFELFVHFVVSSTSLSRYRILYAPV
ncbi:hypothetical protein MPLB_1200069 [Mesorhizobium sp. ORS 3324]|nr:hypothetical protein MPLB_1200069 [Mesorhizobium sp. ORS 3324]